MTPSHEQIREEWKEDGIYGTGIETFPNGEVDMGGSADAIADWWLSKLQEDRQRLVEVCCEDCKKKINA